MAKITDAEKIAKTLPALMMAKGIGTGELAKKISVSNSSVSYWRSGYRAPTKEQTAKLISFFGCTIEDLFPSDRSCNLLLIQEELAHLNDAGVVAVEEFVRAMASSSKYTDGVTITV